MRACLRVLGCAGLVSLPGATVRGHGVNTAVVMGRWRGGDWRGAVSLRASFSPDGRTDGRMAVCWRGRARGFVQYVALPPYVHCVSVRV